MNEEENKAIDLLKNIDKQKCAMLECPVVKNNIKRQLKIIELNRLIRKQSKEIEELKEKNEYLPAWVSKKYISKDKIKAKIEEYDDEINQLRIDRNVTFDSLIYRNSIKKDALQDLLEDK